MPDASFAGQQDTYLWIVGEDDVVERVKACWASLFNARAISYRAKNGLGGYDAQMGVGVQKMVDAAAAGVAMTLDPINGDRSKIVIDSAFGLGEPVVSGEITPDNFVVEKVMLEIVKRKIVEKDQRTGGRPRGAPDGSQGDRSLAPCAALAERCAGDCGRAPGQGAREEHGLPAGRRVGDRSRSARRRERRHPAEPAGDRLEPEEGGAAKRPTPWESRACRRAALAAQGQAMSRRTIDR